MLFYVVVVLIPNYLANEEEVRSHTKVLGPSRKIRKPIK